MAVNFNGINSNSVPSQRTNVAERADTGTAKPESSVVPNETRANEGVNLSNRAKAIKQAEQQLREQPEIDDARVAQIRQALDEGTYKINAEKLAQKMLEMDESIFGR